MITGRPSTKKHPIVGRSRLDPRPHAIRNYAKNSAAEHPLIEFPLCRQALRLAPETDRARTDGRGIWKNVMLSKKYKPGEWPLWGPRQTVPLPFQRSVQGRHGSPRAPRIKVRSESRCDDHSLRAPVRSRRPSSAPCDRRSLCRNSPAQRYSRA